jgi:hypothetical protein
VLFSELSSNVALIDARMATFHLIAYKCRNSPGALVAMPGGVGFFKNLVYQRSPALAYHAACFLLDHLQAAQPVEYRDLLTRLVVRARHHRDPQVCQLHQTQSNRLFFCSPPSPVTPPQIGIDRHLSSNPSNCRIECREACLIFFKR